MSGGAPSAAPASALANGEAPSGPQNPQKSVAPKAPAKNPEAAPEWGENDDKDLFDRLQKAPWAKVKANGEEKRITSREEFLALATDASRSRGMNKLAEQTKREQAEARQAKEEAASQRQLLERARAGDAKALRELGLVPDNERVELQRQWESMSPEQQALHRRNFELEQRLSEVEQKESQEKQAALDAKKKERQQAAVAQAREHAQSILKDVKAELYDVELPEIIGAMHELLKTSQRIGRDYTHEQLAAYVQQRRSASLDSRVSNLKPEAALRMAVPHLKALISTPEGLAQLEEVFGVDFELIAGKLSGRRLEKWKASQQKKALSGEVQKPAPREDAPGRPNTLPHFRF